MPVLLSYAVFAFGRRSIFCALAASKNKGVGYVDMLIGES